MSGFEALIEDVKMAVSGLKLVDLTLTGADRSFEAAVEALCEPLIA